MQHALDENKSLRNPGRVLRLIDEYAEKYKYLMNVGSKKGSIVTKLIAERQPKQMIEFGSYVGYSTILFANAVREHGGARYISFERDAKFSGIASALVRLAGLNDIVSFVVGSSSKNIFAEHANGRLQQVDMVFLDHYKPSYVRDLKICESLGLIAEGTVLAADNIITPGNPSYLEYVRSSPEEKRRKLAEMGQQGVAIDQRFQQRTVNQYNNVEEDNAVAPGNPEIVYESYLVHSEEPTGDPDGIEVTTCIHV